MGRLIKPAKLKDLHREFADQYLVSLNAAEAYRTVSELRGTPVKTPAKCGFAILQRPEVQAYIQEQQKRRAERVGLTQDDVLRELRDQLSVTVPDIVEWDEEGSRARPSADLSQIERRAIKRFKCVKRVFEVRDPKTHEVVSTTTTVQTEVEIHDRMQVVQKLGQHLGMWKEPEPHAGQVPVTALVIVPTKLTKEAWTEKVAEALAIDGKPVVPGTPHASR